MEVAREDITRTAGVFQGLLVHQYALVHADNEEQDQMEADDDPSSLGHAEQAQNVVAVGDDQK